MEDINGVSTTEYLGPTFSINLHDNDGDPYCRGIFLHYSETAIVRVARTLRGFKAYVRHLETMVKEIEETIDAD